MSCCLCLSNVWIGGNRACGCTRGRALLGVLGVREAIVERTRVKEGHVIGLRPSICEMGDFY